MTGHVLIAHFVEPQHFTGECECGWMLTNVTSLDEVGNAHVIHLREVRSR